MNRFVFEILEENREYYNSLSLEEFMQAPLVDDAMVREFVSFTRNEGYNLQVTTYTPVLKQYLKATMAQQLFGTNEFEQIVNEGDRVIEKVVELSRTN